MDAREDLLEQALVETYQLKHAVTPDNLYLHLYLRYLFLHMKKGRIQLLKSVDRNRRLASFLLDDLHIQQDSAGNILLNAQTIDGKYQWGTPIHNIMENWMFRTEMVIDNYPFIIDEWIKKCTRSARSNAWTYVDTPIYYFVYQQKALAALNDYFEVVPGTPSKLHLQQDEERVSIEEKLNAKILKWKSRPRNNIRISEAQLENFIFHHLDRLEEGLCPIQQQVPIGKGRVDIVARDRTGRDTLLELKVEKDTDIVWQRMYYESEWEKNHHKPRIILIMPHLDQSIHDALLKTGETEVFLYEAIVREDILEDVRIKRKICIK